MTLPIRYPRPLAPGSLIAVTAPSSGVEPSLHPRLDLVIDHLKAQGFRVREGKCLRREHKNASAPRKVRAAELMSTLLDDSVDAVLPPWGGELAVELLTLLDFDALSRARPKWLLGFSDTSSLMLPLTLRCGWATAHGPNLMDLAPGQDDPLTARAMLALMRQPGDSFEQRQSSAWQRHWEDWAVNPAAPYRLTELTQWKCLQDNPTVEMTGRLIGGCLDTLMHVSGSVFGDVAGFVRRCGDDGAIVYLENVSMVPTDLVRALWSVRLAGWFDGARGVLVGRSAAPDAKSPADLGTLEALHAVLGELTCPVLFDVDTGHVPPQMTLVNGAVAQVHWSAFDGGRVTQRFV